MIIPGRFNGPHASANGGYASGLIASYVAGGSTGVGSTGVGATGVGSTGVEVTLRRPPPLDTELTVRREDVVRVFHGPDLVAEAMMRPVCIDEAVAPVGFERAVEASRSYSGFAQHHFPRCFVCGPDREVGDGLRVFPGRLPDGRVAAPFVAPDGISEVIVWACLDCPSGWAVPLEARPYVLGRIAVRVNALPNPGDKCVVMGRMTSESGRKANSASTLYSPAGAILAVARATWIAL